MAESQDCRIPLSIKVDRGESLYQNLIAPARDEGRLTTLIIELLRAYYDDEVVRNCVDKRMTKTDEFKAVQDQIERMLLEHAKNIAQTQALEFEAQQANRGTTTESDKISIDEDSGTKESETTVAMMQMVQNLAAKVESLSEQIKAQPQPQQVVPMPYMYNYATMPYSPYVDANGQPLAGVPIGAIPVQNSMYGVPPIMNVPNTQNGVTSSRGVEQPTPITPVEPIIRNEVADVEPIKEVEKTVNTEEKPIVKEEPVTIEEPVANAVLSDTVPENPFAKKPNTSVTGVAGVNVVRKGSGLVINEPVVKTVTGAPVDTEGGEVKKDTAPKKRRPASFMKTVSGLDRTE